MTLSPTEFACRQQQAFDAATTAPERRARGHFGTPRAIAGFMADLFGQMPAQNTLRVIDPGAGVGMLSAAVCERLLTESSKRHVYVELWEANPALESVLKETMECCKRALQSGGHRLDYSIRIDDFIIANTQRSLFDVGPAQTFDFAILNPPYYKLRKDSPHAKEMAHVVHGQPNIYNLFMAVAADLLVSGGRFVAITPRSYFNGPYFKRFRKWFFDRMTVRQIHMFDSRKDAFRDDAVLQENVILLAEKGSTPREVVLTSSEGRDLGDLRECRIAYQSVIANSAGDHVVRVTTNQADHDLIEALDSLPGRLRSFDFEISTGPVVTFRATEFLRDHRSHDTAPLLWMHNVRPFLTQFPKKGGKPPHIVVSDESKRLLLPAKRYVLLKRFTAKEENRRLVAGIVEPDDLYSDWVGLENHLNYVYCKRAGLTKLEAWGLAAYFNSTFVDRYFRAVSGNTQVNAAEIRAMPLPDRKTISRIGLEVESMRGPNPSQVDFIVASALGLLTVLSINRLSVCNEQKGGGPRSVEEPGYAQAAIE